MDTRHRSDRSDRSDRPDPAGPDSAHDDGDHDHGGVFPPEPVRRQRIPAGQALVVMLACLIGAAFLNADRLAYTARSQSHGWQRTVAVRITGGLTSVSDGLRLNRPRKFIAALVDNEDPPPPEDTDDIDIVNPQGAGTTTTTRPPDFRVPSTEEPVRILVAGDSLMGWIGPALVDSLEGYPIDVTEDWVVATGLARPDFFNWPAQLRADMAQKDPEVVIVGFGGNDMQDIETESGWLKAGSREWKLEYQRRVAQVLNTVEAPNRTVYWIGLPLTARADIEAIAPAQIAAVKAEISARPWAHFIDTREILSPDGVYSQYLRDRDGTEVKVREGDGVHPNIAGATRMVAPVVEALLDERKVSEAIRRSTTTTTTPSSPSTTTRRPSTSKPN